MPSSHRYRAPHRTLAYSISDISKKALQATKLEYESASHTPSASGRDATIAGADGSHLQAAAFHMKIVVASGGKGKHYPLEVARLERGLVHNECLKH